MNTIYTKKLSLFEIISSACDVIKNCAVQLFALSFVSAVFSTSVKVLAEQKRAGFLKSPGMFYTLILLHLLFFSAFIAINCAKIVKAYTKTGKPLPLTDALKQSVQKIWALISTQLVIYAVYIGIAAVSILVIIFCTTLFKAFPLTLSPTNPESFFHSSIGALVAILLFFALIISIIGGSIYLAFIFQALALDNKANISALKQSYEVVRGNWFKTFLLFVIIGTPLGLSSLIFKNNIALLIIYTLGGTLSMVTQTLLYLNLQAQK